MSDNPYEAPQADLTPVARSFEKEIAASPPDELPANSRFSMLALLLMMSCAAVNAAAYAQPLTHLPLLALACNAVFFFALLRDLQKYSDDLRVVVHCILFIVLMAASLPLLLIVLTKIL